MAGTRKGRLAALAWSLLATVLLLTPGPDLPGRGLAASVETAIELSVHVVLFLVLAALARRGFGSAIHRPGRKSRIFAVVLAYCVLLEILQIAVPGRGFEMIDIAAGGVGAAIGMRARRP